MHMQLFTGVDEFTEPEADDCAIVAALERATDREGHAPRRMHGAKQHIDANLGEEA